MIMQKRRRPRISETKAREREAQCPEIKEGAEELEKKQRATELNPVKKEGSKTRIASYQGKIKKSLKTKEKPSPKSIRRKHVQVKNAPGSKGLFCRHCRKELTEDSWALHMLHEHVNKIEMEDKMLVQKLSKNPNYVAPSKKRKTKSKKRKSDPIQSSRSITSGSGFDNRAEERRLDGSPGLEFREHGRFGSHSMHDDYGDESHP